jgi:hypothetical protein
MASLTRIQSIIKLHLSEILRDPVTDTSQITSAIHGSGLSRGPFLPNVEEVTRGHRQLAGEQASAGQDGHASRADAKPGGTRTVHLAEHKFTGSKEIAYCGNVVNKEQIPKEGARGLGHLWYPEPRSLDLWIQPEPDLFDVVKRARAHNS